MSGISDSHTKHYAKWLHGDSEREADDASKSRSASTVSTYLRHLGVVFAWALDQGLMAKVPRIELPTISDDDEAKGRPLSGEEFDRLLAKTGPALFDPPALEGKRKPPARKVDPQRRAEIVASWEFFLTGLWLSGLRLTEALNLSWDDDDRMIHVSGRTMFFPARKNKRRKVITAPMTPDFHEHLQKTPEDRRAGFVFNPIGVMGTRLGTKDAAGSLICRMGEMAGIIVKLDDDDAPVKFASAHDLRRSFGARRARKVVPAVLKELMRHRSIDTTMKYYAKQDAEAIADLVWQAAQKAESVPTFVPNPPSITSPERKEKAANPCE